VVNAECIIYTGIDIPCYGIKNGDSIKTILDIIFDKLNVDDCSCTFGTAIAQVILPITTTTTIAPTTTTTSSTTTSTTSSTTTTTTTAPPQPLCFSIVGESLYECSTENKSILPGVVINGKVSYSFEYDGSDYLIKWSIVNDRWELFNITNDPLEVISYLNSNSTYPIGPLDVTNVLNPSSLVWKRPVEVVENYVVTRTSCPQILCFEIESEGDTVNVQLLSYYDTLDNLPSSPISTKPYYLSPCSETPNIFTIMWNSFTNVYELYDGSDKIAYSNVQNIETVSYLNWIIYPEFATSIASVKSKIGFCL
jgi:hypothetical protein